MKDRRRVGPSSADLTRRYIDDHSSLREGLRENLVNFTSLARKIQTETGIANEEAVSIACRRYQRDIGREARSIERIRDLVSESRLEVHSGVAIVRLRDDFEVLDRILTLVRHTLVTPSRRRLFELFLGARATTILCDESYLATVLPAIPERLLLGTERGLGTLVLRSRLEVQDHPGVLSFLVDALYRSGINAVEVVSVHTDSIFVFQDAELLRAYQALSELVALGPTDPAPALPRVA